MQHVTKLGVSHTYNFAVAVVVVVLVLVTEQLVCARVVAFALWTFISVASGPNTNINFIENCLLS